MIIVQSIKHTSLPKKKTWKEMLCEQKFFQSGLHPQEVIVEEAGFKILGRGIACLLE